MDDLGGKPHYFRKLHPLINGGGILGVYSPPTDPISLDPNFLPFRNILAPPGMDGREVNPGWLEAKKNRVVGSLRCFFFWMDTESIPYKKSINTYKTWKVVALMKLCDIYVVIGEKYLLK